MLAFPIFPASHPASIFGVHELNFCVRDGNRWTLMPSNTNTRILPRFFFLSSPFGPCCRQALEKTVLISYNEKKSAAPA